MTRTLDTNQKVTQYTIKASLTHSGRFKYDLLIHNQSEYLLAFHEKVVFNIMK